MLNLCLGHFFARLQFFQDVERVLNSFGLLFCSFFPVLSFPLFLDIDGIGHFWVYVHHIFRKSFHSLIVSASDRCNFTSLARPILFRSPIHRLGKPLMTSCFIMRGSLHALVTPSFISWLLSQRQTTLYAHERWLFGDDNIKRAHRPGPPELRLRKLHLLPLHCLQSNLKERSAFGLLVQLVQECSKFEIVKDHNSHLMNELGRLVEERNDFFKNYFCRVLRG